MGFRRGKEHANIFHFSRFIFIVFLIQTIPETLPISTCPFLTSFLYVLLVSGVRCRLQVDVQR